jgi:hypothetical protein
MPIESLFDVMSFPSHEAWQQLATQELVEPPWIRPGPKLGNRSGPSGGNRRRFGTEQ